MTIVGVTPSTVLLADPDRGVYWVTRSTFETAYTQLNHMAVILD